MSTTVYTSPGCGPCKATVRALERANVRFEVVDLAQDSEALRHVTADLGYTEAPVVEGYDKSGREVTWTGFRPDLIEQLHDRDDEIDDTHRYAGPFCSCGDYSCPAMNDQNSNCAYLDF